MCLVLLIVGVCLTPIISANSDNRVVIFSCMDAKRNDELSLQLKKEFPDLDIVIQYFSTGNLGAKIKAEGTAIEADIILDLETALLETVIDNLADISHVERLEYIEGLNPEHNRYLIWQKYDGVIAVNQEILDKLGLEIPKTYEDLLKPEYKGLIVAADPKVSGTGYMYLVNWCNLWGEEKAFEYVDKLQKNIALFTTSGSRMPKILYQGEAAIALAVAFNVVTQQDPTNELLMVVPDTGSPYNLTGSTIIKGKDKNKNVVEVFNYIMTEFMVYDKIHFSPGKVLKNQGKTKLEGYPENIVSADMTNLSDIKLKERLLSKWDY